MTVVEPDVIMSSMMSPEAQQALDVAAARYALQQAPESADLLDKVRAIELAVKRRRAPLSAMLGALMLFGCSSGRPTMTVGCDLAVSSDAGSSLIAERALERINAATGCSVHEAESGAPLRLVPVALDKGKAVCGATTIGRWSDGSLERVRLIEVSTEVDGCNSREAIMVHEVLHAMLGTNGIHAAGGVFHAVSGNGELIDETTLETVCGNIDCPVFSPEN